ncbi:ABC transporter substrate-binding protein [Rubritalea tangerina]|uniref:ABC transporter substrate-binding protein n=1 Tax=Rubritalea tangerina TaxID=430798 RepID=A0ABW4ZAH4_9BACT
MKLRNLIASASAALIASLSLSHAQLSQQPLTEVIKAPTGTPNTSKNWRVPMITWGADLQEIEANGGLKTSPNSIFGSKGLTIELFRQDDFRKQVELYKKGEINFLRGTVGMLNAASELLNTDPATEFEVIYLLSRSNGGDALVAKQHIKTIKDLKGATIAVQAYGPHVDYMSTILRSAGLSIKDVKVVWCPDLFLVDENSKSPILALEGSGVDAAFGIIPEALAATSDGTVGSGAEGSIKGAHILLSTKSASNVIYDVYAVRKSFATQHKQEVEKFVNGMLVAREKLAKKMANQDPATLKRGAQILLDDPSATEDMLGMYKDAAQATWSENKAFLNSPHGRNLLQVSDKVQEDFVTMGLLSRKHKITSNIINFDALKQGLTNTSEQKAATFDAAKRDELLRKKQQKGALSEGELYSFEIYFQPGQNNFPASQYEQEFAKALELISIYGGAILTVEGHSDPLGYLKNKYKQKAAPIVLQKQKQAALNLSYSRANAVKSSLMDFAKSNQLVIDESQFGVIGHGIVHPNFKLDSNGDIDKSNAPKTKEEWNRMRRVKFRLVQVEAEAEVFEPLGL